MKKDMVAAAEQRSFDVLNYGAVGDGKTVNTRSIQAAIDACSKAGGAGHIEAIFGGNAHRLIGSISAQT